MSTKPLFLLVLILVIQFTESACAQQRKYGEKDYETAVNIAGKQRMLTQKISKAYLLLTIDENNKKAEEEMLASIDLFQRQLEILLKNSNNNKTEIALVNVRDHWKTYLNLLQTQRNLTTANLIMEKNSYLLELCQLVVDSIESNYENLSDITEEEYRDIRLVNISGRQRMLSQRICLYYIGASVFSKKGNNYKLVLRRAFDNFDNTIIQLITYPGNTKEIRKQLGKVLMLWEHIKNNKNDLYRAKYEINTIYKTTNELTAAFDIITKLYEKLGRKKKP